MQDEQEDGKEQELSAVAKHRRKQHLVLRETEDITMNELPTVIFFIYRSSISILVDTQRRRTHRHHRLVDTWCNRSLAHA